MGKLKKEHEAFCQFYVTNGKNASQAYAKAYDRTADNTTEVNASRLLRNAKVIARVKELQTRQQKANDITLARVTEMLVKTHQDAEQEGDITNARACAMDLAKLHGLVVDRSKVESENVNFVVSDSAMNDDEWEAEYGDKDAMETAEGSARSVN